MQIIVYEYAVLLSHRVKSNNRSLSGISVVRLFVSDLFLSLFKDTLSAATRLEIGRVSIAHEEIRSKAVVAYFKAYFTRCLMAVVYPTGLIPVCEEDGKYE